MSNEVQFDKIVNVSTIDVPLLVGYKILDFKKTANLRVFGGPKLRFDAGSSMDFNNFSTEGAVTKEDLTKDIKAAKLGLEAGIGIDVLMFTLDARYNIIGDLYQTKLGDKIISKIPANTFVISLGWKIF
ncbi:MAG: outer membrane beta-barrel protein [Paludibacter sp.]|nr:outer membrane beta-barrel protein [Paludibacter sp.]